MQESPTALIWKNCFIASLLASLPLYLFIVVGKFAERTKDFLDTLFSAGLAAVIEFTVDGLGRDLKFVAADLLLWLGILYFSRRRELDLWPAILIGLLAGLFAIFAVLLMDFWNDWRGFEDFLFYFMGWEYLIGIPGGVVGGLLAWFYVRRAHKKPFSP